MIVFRPGEEALADRRRRALAWAAGALPGVWPAGCARRVALIVMDASVLIALLDRQTRATRLAHATLEAHADDDLRIPAHTPPMRSRIRRGRVRSGRRGG